MQTLSTRLDDLEQKVRILLRKLDSLSSENRELKEENNQLKWIYNIDQNTTRETIVLQPGKYRVVNRGLNSNKVIYTQEKSFTISSGTSVQIKF